MRAHLDIRDERLVKDHTAAEPLASIALGLGEPPLELQLVNGPLPSGTVIDFLAKATISGPPIVSGSHTLTAAASSVSLDEDWKAATLIALFTGETETVRLKGQYRWHLPTDPEGYYHRAPRFNIDVEASNFTEDFVPGASVPIAPFLYLSAIDAYMGSETSLEEFVGARVPSGALLKVIIGGSESEWRLTKPAGEVITDLDAGVIRLLDGTGYLTRVGGL